MLRCDQVRGRLSTRIVPVVDGNSKNSTQEHTEKAGGCSQRERLFIIHSVWQNFHSEVCKRRKFEAVSIEKTGRRLLIDIGKERVQ